MYTSLHAVHHTEWSVSLLLTFLSAVAFMLTTDVLLKLAPTRAIGQVLMQRVTHAIENWRTHTVRSYLEV